MASSELRVCTELMLAQLQVVAFLVMLS